MEKCVDAIFVVSFRLLDSALTERFLMANLLTDIDGLVTPIGAGRDCLRNLIPAGTDEILD